MEIGMLWFDNDKKSDYEAKIERAASMFLQRTSNCANMIHSEENEKSLCGTMRRACA